VRLILISLLRCLLVPPLHVEAVRSRQVTVPIDDGHSLILPKGIGARPSPNAVL
jgi:hypothetical protein